MTRKIFTIIAYFTLFLMYSSFSFAVENSYQSNWMSNKEFQATFNRMTENRFYTHFVEGRVLDGLSIQYRGEFRPIFKNLKHWYSFHGMSDDAYAKRKAVSEAKGYRELYHTLFLDVGGLRFHQACWIEFFDPSEGIPQEMKSKAETSI